MASTREFRSGERVVVIRQSGIADGRDYVLVHGLGMSHEYWDGLAEVLEATGTVYALDLPGFGDAPEPREPLGMAESGELIAELIAAEGLDRPVLVGHSTGAQVVAETAARHPELVDSLVLIGPTVNPRERTLAKQTARFLQDVAVLNPKAFAQGVASYAEAGPRWYVRNLRPMLEHRIELALPEIARRRSWCAASTTASCPATGPRRWRRCCPKGATSRCPDAATRRWTSPAGASASSSPGTRAASRPAARWRSPRSR